MSKSILVTGIGGVVGQGILRNIKLEFPSIKLIGTNTVAVSAGNYLCDEVYKVPLGNDPNYIHSINSILLKQNIDLIIPSTDLESYHLGLHSNELNGNAMVAISPADLTGMCLDKLLTYQKFKAAGLPFAESLLPNQYNSEFDKTIVKPRSGRGSRGIYINPTSLSAFDESYMLQEFLDGPEITTAFYVTRDKKLHGHITFLRELESGNTSKAEVTFSYDNELGKIINKMIQHFDFKGSINIQSKVTEKGIIPFEINCRISGTNSIRPYFGFKDVKYTVQEWLFNQSLEEPIITKGCALRVIEDIIYPEMALNEINNCKDSYRHS
jgi:carbamoyl-phosphate synthase large subunit